MALYVRARLMRAIGMMGLMTAIGGSSTAEQVPVVIGEAAGQVEQTAAAELSRFLGEIYRGDQFPVQTTVPTHGKCIAVGTRSSMALVSDNVTAAEVNDTGEFVVTHVTSGDLELGIICGQCSKAALDGVYSLLEQKLGYGFYLTANAHESMVDEAFSFARWNLTARPLVLERSALDWHNFLTGCATWDLAEWLDYVRQVARMRYSHILIHNYQNNPMLQFTFNGYTKPVGWLSSTDKGRTYAVDHVWDARNMVGAPGVIEGDERVFGSDSAKVPDAHRAAAAKNMMRTVFAEAAKYGVGVIYAVDVGTHATYPTEMMESTLPASARFESGGKWLVYTDTPEGYAFWRAFVERIMSDYPDVTDLVTWIRVAGTPATNLTADAMPSAWQTDYANKVAQHPEADVRLGPCAYYWAKVSSAWRRALDELGYTHVNVGFGSWTWDFSKFFAASAFHPTDMRVYISDYMKKFGKSDFQADLASIGEVRPITLIDWAQHDDRDSYGRPYVPEANYPDVLASHKTSGFSVTHWYTRPLDFFFKNVMNQVWSNTKNETPSATCDKMARDYWGASAAGAGASYLTDWLNKCPMFGTENYGYMAKEDKFNTSNSGWVISNCDDRIAVLQGMDDSQLSEIARKRKEYFIRHEEWIKSIYTETTKLHVGTQDAIADANPARSIVKFADAAQVLGVTPGDKGMLCHLNFTWLPYFVRKQQQFGSAAYRLNFLPTHHDSLARKPGRRTYYYDRERRPWCGRGERETGIAAFEDMSLSPTTTHEEVCATWISGTSSFTVQLIDAVGDTASLSAGNYDVQLFFPGHLVTGAGQRVVRVRVGGNDLGEIDLYSGSAVTVKTVSDISISPGKLQITVEKVTGDPAISGVALATDISVGVRGSRPSMESSYPIEQSPLNSLAFGVDGGDNAPDMPAEDPHAPSNADQRQAVAFDDAADEPTESALAIYIPPEELSEPALTPDNQRQVREQEPRTASDGVHAADPRSVVSETEGGAELSSGTISDERAEPKATDHIAVTASSFNGANVPHRTVDGDLSTHWAPAGSNAEWIEYDLGAVRPLAGVVLSWYGQRGCDAQVVASVSEDGARYRVAATHALRGRGFHTTRITFDQLAGRYLRLQLLPGGDRVAGLIEVSVAKERSPVLMSTADGD